MAKKLGIGLVLTSLYCIASLAVSWGGTIQADSAAPRVRQPVVLTTSGGLPQVNIATPNAGGMSYNRYSQFDVASQGAILNNSKMNVQTQLGGWIEGNPHLAGGEARLIVNEVNSSRPSQLNGYLEVAGRRADVVIANPSGINVDGFGFINASRGTLTTGAPQIDAAGNLTGFRVETGHISVDGRGLNATGSDYTDIISRTAAVNAGVWANNLSVVTGRNMVSPDGAIATPLPRAAEETGVSLDVSTLGGMYAGAIRLVGTEKGVGVNSGMRIAGNLVARAGEVAITSDGRLVSSGVVSGQGGVRVDARNDMELAGRLQSGGDLAVAVPGAYTNTAELVAGGRIELTSGQGITNTATGVIQGGTGFALNARGGDVVNDGSLLGGGDSSVTASGAVRNAGDMQAAGALAVRAVAGGIDNQGLVLGEGDVTLRAMGDIVNAGDVKSGGTLSAVSEDGGVANGGDMLAAGGFLLEAKGDVVNTATMYSGGGMGATSSAGKLRNDGDMLAVGVLTAAGRLGVENAGVIQSGGAMTVASAAGTIDNAGDILSNASAALSGAAGVDNAGLVKAVGSIDVASGADMTNDGSVISGGTATLTAAGDIANRGDIQGAAGLTLTAGGLANAGALLSGADAALNVTGNAANALGAEIGAVGTLRFTVGGGLANAGDILADMNLADVGGLLLNTGLFDGRETILRANRIENVATGMIFGDHVALGAASILNGLAAGVDNAGSDPSGLVGARARLDIGAGSVVNREDGLLFVDGDLFVGGSLDGSGLATGRAASFVNASAVIDVLGDFHAAIDDLRNLNMHFATGMRVVGSVPPYFAMQYISGGRIIPVGEDGTFWNDTGSTPAFIEGGWVDSFWWYAITGTTTESYTTASRPGYILVGGDFGMDGGFTNDKSVSVSGSYTQHSGGFANLGAVGQRTVTEVGFVRPQFWDGGQYTVGTVMPYNPAPTVTDIDLPVEMNARPVSPALPGQGAATPAVLVGSSPVSVGGSYFANLPALNPNLFTLTPSPTTRYLVETNPRLTNYREWLSSDFMLDRLNVDPQAVQKRLGDGFYEQRLVREQIAGLVGQRYLGDYSNEEEQYKALMTAGVEFAEEFAWAFGVALSPEMMARLTSDIVWLEYVTVDTPEGPVTALAPRVYLAPGRDSLVDANGALVAARKVDIKLDGDIQNSGTLYGSESLSLAARDIDNSGTIAGKLVSLAALRDINNIGGAVVGVDKVDLEAGRDITIASSTRTTTSSGAGYSGTNTHINNVGSVTVTSGEGKLTAKAERDVNINAGVVASAGSAEIEAGRDLTVGTVDTAKSYLSIGDARNFLASRETSEVGSLISTGGDLVMKAGNDLTVRASQAYADGDMSVKAGGDVSIVEGRETYAFAGGGGKTRKSFLKKKSTTVLGTSTSDIALGSELSGGTVTIESGGDTTIRGSTVAASEGLAVEAGGNITISGADNYSTETFHREDKKSGLGFTAGGGRVGVEYAKSKETKDTSEKEHWIAPSLVGSEHGTVSLYAGKDVAIAGSKVVAGTGDILISGENVTIANQYESRDYEEHNRFERTSIGVSLGLKGTAADIVNQALSARDNFDRAENAMSDRAAALYGMAAARDVYDLGKTAAATAAYPSGATIGVSARTGYSHTESESNAESHETRVVGSQLVSGGDTVIVARGQADGEDTKPGTGDLTIIGSAVTAGGVVTLAANNDINLLSAAEQSSSQSDSKSTTTGIGASIGVSVGQQTGWGISVDASASKNAGSGFSAETRHVETVIQGAQGVEFASVGDTTLHGARIIGETVVGTVGGDLTIVSEQDVKLEHYASKSTSAGAEIQVWGAGTSTANFSTQKQNADGAYASVNEQSGIFAGSGGFDIAVGGHTGLTGAVIDSKATDPEDNILVTGSISTTDIQNFSSYEATTKGFGAELTYDKKDNDKFFTGIENGKGSAMPMLPEKESGGGSSTTHSAVAPGTVIITDEASQLAHTGQTAEQAVASLNRDTANAHPGPLAPNPDLQAILDRQAELADAAARAGKAVAKTVGDISQHMYRITRDKNWSENGIYRAVLHAAGAALVAQLGNGEGLNAAMGTLAAQLANGQIEKFSDELAYQIIGEPVRSSILSNILQNIIKESIGFAVGGESGANAAAYIDRFNRQLHQLERETILSLSKNENGEIDQEKYNRFSAAAAYLVNMFAEYEVNSPEFNYYLGLAMFGAAECQIEINILLKYQSESWYQEFGPSGPITYRPFFYSPGDSTLDQQSASIESYHIGVRMLGLVQAAGGASLIGAGATTEVGSAGFSTAISLVSVLAGSIQLAQGIDTVSSGTLKDSAFVEYLVSESIPREEARRWETIGILSLAYAQIANSTTKGSAVTSNDIINSTRSQLDEFAKTTSTAKLGDTGIVWGKGVVQQGLPWENYLGATKGLADKALPKGFHTFDFYDDVSKTAISAKTLDTNAKIYAGNPRAIESTITSYIDQIASFKEAYLKGKELTATNISTRVLELAIPSNVMQEQLTAIMKSSAYAKSQNIVLNITLIQP